MKKNNPFTAARDHLITRQEASETKHLTGKNFCICFAICEAASRGKISHKESITSRDYVMKQLGPHSTAQTWIEAWARKHSLRKPSYVEVQDYRHQWLTHLETLWNQGKIK